MYSTLLGSPQITAKQGLTSLLCRVQVKMVTADDDLVTDILCEGPEEEMMRFSKELGLNEKGKELVKGLLER